MKRALVLTVALATTLVACGDDAQPSSDRAPARTVQVRMTDMAFAPHQLDVTAGETVRFVFRNDGAVRHEAVLGVEADQRAHHDEMVAMDAGHDDTDALSMPHDDRDAGPMPHDDTDARPMPHDDTDAGPMPHDDTARLHAMVVEPGETVEMLHTFDVDGPTMIGCHEPGHWEAGMQLDIDVT